MFCSWLLVGISQMTPLQVVQAAAAVTATIYTALQIIVLLSDRWKRWRDGR
jgi:hypothetical protein